jgi:uncharacterized protein (TIGR02246 family)
MTECDEVIRNGKKSLNPIRRRGEIIMATTKEITKTNDESQIRHLIQDWRNALCARDLDRLVQHYAADVLFFDAVPPYQHRGAAAYRRTWEVMLPHLPPRIGLELRDLDIKVSGDLAVMHGLTRVINEKTKQDATCGWVRVTVCYQRQKGTWQVIHEHVSVPFDPATSQAVFIREP